MRVKITLNKEQLEQAKEMRRLRNIPTTDDFEGPVFENVKDYGIDSSKNFYGVMLEDGTSYLYPITSIARVAEYQ